MEIKFIILSPLTTRPFAPFDFEAGGISFSNKL